AELPGPARAAPPRRRVRLAVRPPASPSPAAGSTPRPCDQAHGHPPTRRSGSRADSRPPTGRNRSPSPVGRACRRRTLSLMRHEWHQFSYPAVGNPALQTSRPTGDSAEDAALGLDRWRDLPRAQTPPWPDQAAVDEVCRVLGTVPPIVAPYEADQLR